MGQAKRRGSFEERKAQAQALEHERLQREIERRERETTTKRIYMLRIPGTGYFLRCPRWIYNRWPWAGIVHMGDVPDSPAATCSSFVSPLGYTNPERDKREMCPYCYNEDTRRMVGLELIPYEEYHAGKPFKAFECEACRAKFHFATNA